MIQKMESTSQSSPASKNCRQTAISDKASKQSRRKRTELRRLKALCYDRSTSNIERHHGFFKKRRLENEKIAPNETKKVESPSVIVLPLNSQPAYSSSETDAAERGKTTSVTCTAYQSMSVVGRRREMEDAVTVELSFVRELCSRKYDFYGVYDGHGGPRVAHACRDRLHGLLAQVMDSQIEMNWEEMMVESFMKMDEEVNKSEAVGSIGSTAVVAVVGEEVVVVANCGDSRAVMSRGGITTVLSNDHKPDRADELERIEKSGGRVINWNGQRVLGVLATSRSIGDQHLKPYVIAKPEVTVSRRGNMDEFLILASDGLWDVISNDLACEIVRRCLDGRMRRRSSTDNGDGDGTIDAAAVLTELAMARGSKDNISVIVVELNKPASSIATQLNE